MLILKFRLDAQNITDSSICTPFFVKQPADFKLMQQLCIPLAVLLLAPFNKSEYMFSIANSSGETVPVRDGRGGCVLDYIFAFGQLLVHAVRAAVYHHIVFSRRCRKNFKYCIV